KKVQSATASGGTNEGMATVDEELKKTGDKTEQAYLYNMKIALESARTQPDTNRMIEYALEAEKASPTYATAQMLGSLYQQTGQKSEAARYYSLYLERASATGVLNEDEQVYYGALVQELQK